MFSVKACRMGPHNRSGTGYGIKVDRYDRRRFFKRAWDVVTLELEGYGAVVVVPIEKESFWSDTTPVLLSNDIGLWLIQSHLAPWPKGRPPKLMMLSAGGGRFYVTAASILDLLP